MKRDQPAVQAHVAGSAAGLPPPPPTDPYLPNSGIRLVSHGFACSLRSPWPFRGQGAEARCPRLVARERVRDPALPSLRRVLAGRVPRLLRYYEGLRLLPPRLTGLLCSPGDTPAAPGPSLPIRPDAGEPGQEVSGSAPPRADTRTRESGRPLRLLGNPRGRSPCSWTPAGPGCQAVTASGHGPSARSDGGRATRSLISGLNSTAFAPAVYASPDGSPRPTQDSLLAAGQLYQVGLVTHRVPLKGFRLLFLLSQPIRAQERISSAAAAALSDLEPRKSMIAAAVGCSGLFGRSLPTCPAPGRASQTRIRGPRTP